jgi:hypothetical protein
MKNKFFIIFLIIFLFLFIIFTVLFLIPMSCENDFKIYSEKGYCEFNLKTCEGIFGCKEYTKVQVPCGSISTLCGGKVLCDCDEDKNPLGHFPQNIDMSKEYRSFSYTSKQLINMSVECGEIHEEGYFDKLVNKFSDSREIVYSFRHKNSNKDSRAFVVTLLPNKAGYLSLEEFKKDFNLCAAGGELYPRQLNKDWLLFVNSCGSGAGNRFEDDFSCDKVKEIVGPSLELN